MFPEVFVPGMPIWIDGPPIWDGDEQWFAMLADQAVVVPSEPTDRLGAAARQAGVYLVIGVNEREATGKPSSPEVYRSLPFCCRSRGSSSSSTVTYPPVSDVRSMIAVSGMKAAFRIGFSVTLSTVTVTHLSSGRKLLSGSDRTLATRPSMLSLIDSGSSGV